MYPIRIAFRYRDHEAVKVDDMLLRKAWEGRISLVCSQGYQRENLYSQIHVFFEEADLDYNID